jgi:hypothetical protein
MPPEAMARNTPNQHRMQTQEPALKPKRGRGPRKTDQWLPYRHIPCPWLWSSAMQQCPQDLSTQRPKPYKPPDLFQHRSCIGNSLSGKAARWVGNYLCSVLTGVSVDFCHPIIAQSQIVVRSGRVRGQILIQKTTGTTRRICLGRRVLSAQESH